MRRMILSKAGAAALVLSLSGPAALAETVTTPIISSHGVVADTYHGGKAHQTRIVPDHVSVTQLAQSGLRVPRGYQPAWDDDRLNRHRAHMTPNGFRAAQQIWSNTVPRRLLTKPQDIRDPNIVGSVRGLGH